MGVNTMAPEMQKAMMWGFPMLTILFTWWLPAALQLSFFVSGVLSAAQATLFRKAWFRHRFGMTPLPTKPSKTDAPVSAYKGTLKRVASPGPLSTTELGNRFEGPKAGLQKTVGQIRDMQPPAQSKLKEILGAPISGIKGTIDSIKDAGKGAVDMTKERMAKNKEKSAINERKAYEAKRQEELKKERWERENQQRAERAARRAMKDKEQ
jgi:YidC/Oxa1 family membrane protein insertase